MRIVFPHAREVQVGVSYILQAPTGRAALTRGMGRMTRLLRVTLGPVAGTVAIASLLREHPPEILDSAATIARRMTGVGDPFEDMGAMIIRHLAWRVFERVGDGVATAAVLAQALVEGSMTYVAAGGSPSAMKRGIERGLEAALEELRKQARVVEEPEEIAALVAGTVRDEKLAGRLGSIVDAVGPDGSIQVEDGDGVETTWEYLDGVRWKPGYASTFLLRKGESTARLLNPRILATDHHLETAEQVIPILEACAAAGERSLVILAPDVKDAAVGVLVVNRDRGRFDQIMAIKAPHFGAQQREILRDVAVITGGRCVLGDRHDRLADVTIDDFGRARQVWVSHSDFGIVGGHGSKAAIRDRIAEARLELRAVDDDEWTRERIQERIGKLAGLAAVIKVGAATASDRADLKLRVEAAVASARAAVQDGVVPGGGAALLACIPAVEGLALTGDEVVGAKILARALVEPMRTLAQNAGQDGRFIAAQARERGPDWAFDVVRGEWVDCWEAGLLDPLRVLATALETAVSAAGVALTSDVLIHRPDAQVVVQP